MVSEPPSASAPPAASADACPVDHKARAAWLEQARSKPSGAQPQPNPSDQAPRDGARPLKTRPLSQDREVSTIPRAGLGAATVTPSPGSRPANSEADTGADARSGNWIYPSEKMFFDAMRRKNHGPHATDMAAIVPIHNAVNERAWKEIRLWEGGRAWAGAANARCGGPRLLSFAGDSGKLTPRARLNTWLGYQAPFDRHDWVIERCPGEPGVEYVIDFYSGRDDGSGRGLNFYLDVRPKLNTWEGWKMRAARFVGL